MSFLFLVNLVKGNSGIKRIWTTLKAVLTLDFVKINNKGCESDSVMSDSLWPHGLYVACQVPLSMEFSRPEYRSGLPFPSPGDFPTQGSNPGLPHCRQTLDQLSHKGSPRILEWVAYSFSSRLFQTRNQTRVSCMAGRFFTSWAMREAWNNLHLNRDLDPGP